MAIAGSSTAKAVAGVLPLPVAPTTDFWDDTQWAIFWSLIEAAVPAYRETTSFNDGNEYIGISKERFSELYDSLRSTLANPPSEEQFRAFLSYNAVKDETFRDNVVRTLCTFHASGHKAVGGGFSTMKYALSASCLD